MNMDRRRFLILSGGIAVLPSLRWTGVLAQDATPSASPVADPATMYGPVQGNSPYKLAFMQVFPDIPFWQTMKEAVEARAAEDGVTVDTFALPTASGVADQVSLMENAVTQQYEGIILGTVIGAVVGEIMARQGLGQATKVGVAAGLGFILAIALKLAIALVMIAVFAWAYYY